MDKKRRTAATVQTKGTNTNPNYNTFSVKSNPEGFISTCPGSSDELAARAFFVRKELGLMPEVMYRQVMAVGIDFIRSLWLRETRFSNGRGRLESISETDFQIAVQHGADWELKISDSEGNLLLKTTNYELMGVAV